MRNSQKKVPLIFKFLSNIRGEGKVSGVIKQNTENRRRKVMLHDPQKSMVCIGNLGLKIKHEKIMA